MKALTPILQPIGYGATALGELAFYNPHIALPLTTGVAMLCHSYLRHRRMASYQENTELRGRLTQLHTRIEQNRLDTLRSEDLISGIAPLDELKTSEEARTKALKLLEPKIRVMNLNKEDASAQWEMLGGLFLIVVALVLWDRETNPNP